VSRLERALPLGHRISEIGRHASAEVMSRPPRAAPERLAGKCAADAVNALAAIVAAIATSELTPSEASSVSGVIQNFTKTIETAELEERIRRLEKAAK
jgi:hypothetical protein